MKIGIITAMSSEYSHIAALLTGKQEIKGRLFNYCEGSISGNTIRLMQSGIGKVNSSLGAMELIGEFAPDCVISTGVAGGIDESLSVMDVVVSSRCCYHDVWCGEGNERGQVQGLPLYFECCETLYDCMTQLKTDGRIHGGLICSGDQFITERRELDRIKGLFPEALAVDMESTSIAQCCHLSSVPFISFRVISDTPGAVENHQSQYENFWGEIASRSFVTIERLLSSLPEKI